MRKLQSAVIMSFVALAVAACGGSSRSATPASAPPTSSAATSGPATAGVKISSRALPGLGPVLVDAHGRTLYTFAPDRHAKVTCVGVCASVWPPALLPSGQKPLATGSVKQSLLGSDPDPSGGQVITYAGWPLYTYVSDTAPGQASGEALNLNGGLWYVISPSGKVITKKS